MRINLKDGIVVRDSVATDIEPIANDMRTADIQEIWSSHKHTPLKAMTLAFYTSTLCYTVEHLGKRVAMFGAAPESFLGNRGTIWLLATRDFEKCHRKLVRHSRMFIGYLLRHYPYLENYVSCDNKLSVKWLKFCGCDMEEAKPYGAEGKLFQKFSFTRSVTCNTC